MDKEQQEAYDKGFEDGIEGRYYKIVSINETYKIPKSITEHIIRDERNRLREAVDSNFISKAELRERIEWMKKYHKEFECKGAYGGRGCYETFCEDQNCKNAPKEYNQALKDVLNLLS